MALIPKEPLKVNADYEVGLSVDVGGKPWSKTWRFNTSPAAELQGPPAGALIRGEEPARELL